MTDQPEWDGRWRLDKVDRKLGVPFKAFMVACIARKRGEEGKRHDLARWWERADQDKRALLRKAIEGVMKSSLTIEEIINGRS